MNHLSHGFLREWKKSWHIRSSANGMRNTNPLIIVSSNRIRPSSINSMLSYNKLMLIKTMREPFRRDSPFLLRSAIQSLSSWPTHYWEWTQDAKQTKSVSSKELQHHVITSKTSSQVSDYNQKISTNKKVNLPLAAIADSISNGKRVEIGILTAIEGNLHP